ncbi:MAG TPA: hypothetical protein VF384_01085 [Planctomycetota bacterium]
MRPAGEPIDPDPEAAPDVVADELFVHGLLQTVSDDEASRQRRVMAVMAAITQPQQKPRRVPWLVLGAAAAALVLGVAGKVLLGWLSGPDARTLVDRAVHAAKQAGDRRYEVDATWSAADSSFTLRGELDVRGADRHVLRATMHGMQVTTGSDGGEVWFAGNEMLAAHLREMRGLGHSVFVLDKHRMTLGSIDALVANLAADYRLDPPGSATLPEHAGVAFHRITAHRTTSTPVPDLVEVWIDPGSGLVQRLALLWRVPPRQPDEPDRGADPAAGHRMVLDLVGPIDLPGDWFQAARHR